MKKLNKKGFTLIELLAVIVILAILITVSIPSVTKYLDSSRRDAFVIDITRAVEGVRLDVANTSVANEKLYSLAEINELLDIKLIKSPYGNQISNTSYIKAIIENDKPKFKVCIVDEKGNGIYNSYVIDKNLLVTNNPNDDFCHANDDIEGITNASYTLTVDVNGGSDHDYAYSVASTSDGGYVVTGEYYSSTMTIPANATANNMTITLTNAGGTDIFIIKYNSAGKIEYAKSYGGSGVDSGRSVKSTSDGGYVVTGYYSSTMTIPADSTANNTAITLTSAGGNADIFIIKYNSGGKIVYAKSYGGSSSDLSRSVAPTSDGGYVVTGDYSSTMTIPANDTINNTAITLTSAGDNDIFIIKYNSGGKVEWAKSYGGSSADFSRSVAPTSDGGYVVTGYYRSTMTIPANDTANNTAITLTKAGGTDIFIIKYNSAGKIEYAKSYGGSGTDYGYSIATTSDGGYVVTGHYNSSTITIPANDTINNMAITLTSAGNADIFIIKYNSGGKVKYAKSFGGTGNDSVQSVAPTSDGGYVVTGYYSSTMTIPANDTINNTAITLTSAGGADIFIIKLK